jgi:ribA/ribD-fused uncharacterized protein
MGSGLFPEYDENSLFFSRSSSEEDLGCWSHHPFVLEDREWPSVEHYFQAMKFEQEDQQEKIRQARHPKQARRMGRSRRSKIRPDWAKLKSVYMTRAVYTKFCTYPELKEKLLETGDQKLVENSMYDYYWGCGRDRRGENTYGKVLMNVREKLREQAE